MLNNKNIVIFVLFVYLFLDHDFDYLKIFSLPTLLFCDGTKSPLFNDLFKKSVFSNFDLHTELLHTLVIYLTYPIFTVVPL